MHNGKPRPPSLVVACFAAVVVLATACGSSVEDAVQVLPTATVATATVAPTATAAPEPTVTPAPTARPEATPTPAPTATPEPTPTPEYVPGAVDDPGHLVAGELVFVGTCAGCHGVDGLGSALGRSLLGVAAEQADRLVHINSVSQGKGEMPGLGDRLSDEQVDQVISYVRLTFLAAEPEPSAVPNATPAVEPTAEPTAAVEPPATGSAGAAIFAATCAGCHGIDGTGSSRGRSLTSVALEAPASAHINSVTNGLSPMPAFGGQLTAEQIAAVVEYVRSSF